MIPYLLVLALQVLYCPSARAQLSAGQIQGVITNAATGQPLAGVTIVVSGPALQAEQTEISGADGRYLITQLPPGENYVVRLYYDETIVERPGVRISAGKTLTISLPLSLQRTRKAIVIHERAPSVDTASSNMGVEIGTEILQGTAVRGRTFQSVLLLAPGAVDPPRGAGGDIGVSFGGATGNENAFIVDGLNTTDLSTGVISSQIHQNFIKEISVITGGYQAEYGRATGGVVSLTTKTGGNEFFGSVFGSLQPFQAPAPTVARLGEALGLRVRPDAWTWDLGFDLGGYVIKDRLWFYVGFAPTTSAVQGERLVLARAQGSDAVREVSAQPFSPTERLYNGIVKLQFNINPDHNVTLGYIASPSSLDGYQSYDGITTAQYFRPDAMRFSEVRQIHDLTARYTGKLLGRRLQVELLYGFHYQGLHQRPLHPDAASITYLGSADDPYSVADFEDVPMCARQGSFNPCPLTSYRDGGIGLYRDQVLQRHQLIATASAYLDFLGGHALKLGFDFEGNLNTNDRQYTGTDSVEGDPFSGRRLYETDPTGTKLRIFAQYSQRKGAEDLLLDRFSASTQARNYALYLRDSWNVRPVRGLVVNAGLRWEAQEIIAVDGSRPIGIYDNLAPRVGAVYDFTRKGRSKLYANYGRFYQSIPMTLGDRQFSGEGFYTGDFQDCATRAQRTGGKALPYPGAAAGAPCDLTRDGTYNGGSFGLVAPGIKGQFLDEVAVGINYDVGWDVVLGVGYSYRALGNIIEDLSVDLGSNYLITNPGSPADPGQITALEADVNRLRDRAAATGNAEDQYALSRATARLEAYRAQGTLFPRATREYHGLMVTAQKRVSNRVSILANYVYSRTFGNYPGLFNSSTGDNNPNFSSQFDFVDLMINRTGPLSNDRPHNLKLVGTYTQPLPRGASLSFGLTFSLFSGRPIDVLGAHPIYGRGEVFILPRGAAGRTPTVTQFDLHVGYEQTLQVRRGPPLRLSLFMDVINLFDQQAVTNVDDNYTYSEVAPIADGKIEDLRRLRDLNGELPVQNRNFAQPTAYQAPLYLRLGGRLAF